MLSSGYMHELQQEEKASALRIAKKISEEESVKVKKFTDDLMELMKDILNNPTCLASKMLKDYMDIMRLKKDFSKHPSAPDNGYNNLLWTIPWKLPIVKPPWDCHIFSFRGALISQGRFLLYVEISSFWKHSKTSSFTAIKISYIIVPS